MTLGSHDIGGLLVHRLMNHTLEEAIQRFTSAGFDYMTATLHAQGALREVARELLSTQRVPAPLAFVGMTSAGKSSLINTLIGAQIAPADTRELSAGVLTCQHTLGGPHTYLHGTPEDGSMSGMLHHKSISDAHLYLSTHLHKRRIRRGQTGTAGDEMPRVRVDLDLSILAEFLKIDEAWGLTVRDLPGLRTVDDEMSAAAMREGLAGSICVVVLNYASIYAREQQQAIAEMLRDQRPKLSGPPILVLNRVDLRTLTDQKSPKDVAEELGCVWSDWLRETVTCLPISSNLLSAARLLGSARQSQTLTSQEQAKNLGQTALKSLGELDRKTRSRVWDLWDCIEDGEQLSLEDARWLGALCMKASGGSVLQEYLSTRIRESMSDSPLITRLRDMSQREHVHPSIERQQRATNAVVHVLSGMMYSDDEAHVYERRLISLLSRDYCSRFAPEVQPPELTEVTIEEALQPLREVEWTLSESQWILDACELIMAADTLARESELVYFARVRELLPTLNDDEGY
jgi:hypothetical protein